MKTIYLLLALLPLLGSCKKDDKVVAQLPLSITSITIDKTDPTLVIGDTLQLNVSYSPPNAKTPTFEWSSDNVKVVNVSPTGKLYATGIGSAIVTVRTETGQSAQSKVTVIPIGLTSITLNKDSLSLAFGSSEQLSATFNPPNATNTSVLWTSSDTNYVKVSQSGLVTAVSIGKATITVQNPDSSVSAICKVTVLPIKVTGLVLNKTTLELAVGSRDSLRYTITPVNATNKKVNWQSSDPAIATVSADGVITTVLKGTVAISATTDDGNFQAVCTVIVKDPTDFLSGQNVAGLIVSGSVTYTLSIYFANNSNLNVRIQKASVLDGTGRVLIETTDPNFLRTEVAPKTPLVNIASYRFGIAPQSNWQTKVDFTIQDKEYSMYIMEKSWTILAR
jgi:uncharacterized protein YjdB